MLTLLSTNAAKPLTAAYKTSGKMKSSLPILNHIRIYTDNGYLMAESTVDSKDFPKIDQFLPA